MKPNIVIFLVDDMGTGDTSAYQDWTGNQDDEQLETPNLERLARMGVRFTDAHTPSTVCTPTRYALLTGRYCWRTPLKHQVAFGPHYPPLIELERPTLATILKDAGYHTGISGKWHVGLTYGASDGGPAQGWDDADVRQALADCPLDHGFDYSFITNRSHGSSANAGWIEGRMCIGATGKDDKEIEGYDLHQTGPMNLEHAIGFLEDHLEDGETREKPFFLYYASNSNHTPHTPCDALNGVPVVGQGQFKNGERELSRPHATTNDPNGWESTEWGKKRDRVGGCEHNTPERLDFIYENDVAVGQVLHYLASHEDPRNPEQNLLANTLFIFSSDNGAENAGKESSGFYRGRKAHIHEGGHRVPTIAAWKDGNIGDGDETTPGRTSHICFGFKDLNV
ncbi:MAG: sulfatase-like hydrolase/transferase [bacterium]|nr:sulfatase-like hydrolase/transferase [bacterium]